MKRSQKEIMDIFFLYWYLVFTLGLEMPNIQVLKLYFPKESTIEQLDS